MVDVQTISVVIAAASVVIGVLNSIYSSRIQERQRQTEIDTRQAELFQNIYNEYREKEFHRRIATIYNIWEWRDYDDFEEKYGRKNNPEDYSSWVSTNAYYNGLGVLVDRQLLDINLVSDLLSGQIIRMWEKNGPIITEMRRRRNWPRMYEWFEQLYESVKNIEQNESH